MSILQKCVALSTIEVEYLVATEACKEAIWMIRLGGDLRLGDDMPILHSDSQSAIMLANNPVFHEKTKHHCCFDQSICTCPLYHSSTARCLSFLPNASFQGLT